MFIPLLPDGDPLDEENEGCSVLHAVDVRVASGPAGVIMVTYKIAQCEYIFKRLVVVIERTFQVDYRVSVCLSRQQIEL